jgi:hypothetical protein
MKSCLAVVLAFFWEGAADLNFWRETPFFAFASFALLAPLVGWCSVCSPLLGSVVRRRCRSAGRTSFLVLFRLPAFFSLFLAVVSWQAALGAPGFWLLFTFLVLGVRVVFDSAPQRKGGRFEFLA